MFAVALDFPIVVVGILIAFQITNWSAARQDDLIYEQARTRVIEEATANWTVAQEFKTRARGYQNTAIKIIRDFETCSAQDSAEERFLLSMQTLSFILGLEARNDAINLMLTSDMFVGNISPQDRTTLSVYARRIDTVVKNSRFSGSFRLSRPPPQDNPVFRRTLGADLGSGLARFTLNVSYAELCQDSNLDSFLIDRVENSTYLMTQAQRLAKTSREVLIGLGASPPETQDLEAGR